MSPGLVVDFACAAVLGYGAVFFALLFSRRLTDREYLAFSITSLLFAANEIAHTPLGAERVAAVLATLACAAFVDQLGTLGPRDQRDARLGWWWGLTLAPLHRRLSPGGDARAARARCVGRSVGRGRGAA